MGKLHFDTDNADGCDEYDADSLSELRRSADITPFYIAERGECTFVQKVRNMENIGVSVGIVVDDFAWEDVDNVLMSDDGTGGGIRIPSMLISKNDGEALIEWLATAKRSEINQLVVMAEFVGATEDNN